MAELTKEQRRFVERTDAALRRAPKDEEVTRSQRWREKTGFPVGVDDPREN